MRHAISHAYKPVYDHAWDSAKEARKSLRQTKLRARRDGQEFELRVGQTAESARTLGNPFQDGELYWRWSGWSNWGPALFERKEHLRDYGDFLGPYLNLKKVHRKAFVEFWLQVSAEAVPRNRSVGLVEFYSLDTKVNHGDNMDANHAVHLIDVDVFVTADQGFYSAVEKVSRAVGGATPIMVDRQGATFLGQVVDSIR